MERDIHRIAEMPKHPQAPAMERGSRLSRRKALMSAGILTVAAGMTGAGQFYAEDPGFFFGKGIELALDHNCTSVSEDATDMTRVYLRFPDDKRLVRNLLRAERAYSRGKIKKYEKFMDNYRETQAGIAEAYGFTLLDSENDQEEVSNAQSVDEVLQILNNFGSNFDLKFEIPQEKPLNDFEMIYDSFDPEVHDLGSAKRMAQSALLSLSDLPVELVKLAGVKKVLFVKNLHGSIVNRNEETTFGAYNFKGIIYMDFDRNQPWLEFRKTFAHELGHALDSAICGTFGMYQDEELGVLNSDPSLTLTKYGSASATEDKAEMMMEMLFGLADPSEMPEAVANKYKLILARLEDNLPGISGYLRTISFFESYAPLAKGQS